MNNLSVLGAKINHYLQTDAAYKAERKGGGFVDSNGDDIEELAKISNDIYKQILDEPKSFGRNMLFLLSQNPTEMYVVKNAKNRVDYDDFHKKYFPNDSKNQELAKKLSTIYMDKYNQTYLLRERIINSGRVNFDTIVPVPKGFINKLSRLIKILRG